MTEQQFNDIMAWQKRTFGEGGPLGKIAHLAEELEELVLDLQGNKPEKRLEFADCFLLLFGAAAADGMSYQDICAAIDEKMEVNKARKWGSPDADGIVRHLKIESENENSNGED